ncbi:MAG: ABC transporter permease [Actinomycetota bacterium]|nr:ABC transporter permease [Actinomycetota bacterium]
MSIGPSEPTVQPPSEVPVVEGGSAAYRLDRWQRAGGLVAPVLTAILAFLAGGFVVLATGHSPIEVYKGIWNGTGLEWFYQVGSHEVGLPWSDAKVWFPWDSGSRAAENLQQTLILTASLILTGLAVAFAFRCGLFNIGGQGQYFAGAYVAIWIGSSFAGTNSLLHILFAVVAAGLAGAAFAGIAGILKATVGAHEVITTIMLNFVALYAGLYLFGQGGPLQNRDQVFSPTSNEVLDEVRLPVFWGDPFLQGLHVGLFLSLVALVAFWVIINRTTLGYEVRAVGFNPEAARYGGISVARNYFLAMAIAGCFAGFAGAIDMLGWRFSIGFSDIQSSTIGFVGIAVALLGRNTAIGVGLSALVFGALVNGTAARNIPVEAFDIPEQAGNLSLTIQALVLLFIGADIVILYLWAKTGQRLGIGRRAPA